MAHRSASEGFRVLVSAPYGRDAESVAELLRAEGYNVTICRGLPAIADSIDDDLGVILLTEEALASDLSPLKAALAAQPSWSDVPFVLLTAQRSGRVSGVEASRLKLFDLATNNLVLERPLGRASLISAVASAMRLRQKQFEMRDRMADLDRLNRTLEDKVADRTAALEAEMANRALAEDALRQSQKMEAVGQLTGGIAHDFNNMLTGVIGGLDIVRRRLDSGRLEDVGRFMDGATASAQRAAALTQRLLAFSRRQSLDPRPLDVNALAVSLEELLRRTVRENIALDIRTGADVKSVVADANQLESAILNLAINARDAMPDGGRLTVETSVVAFDADEAAADFGVKPGRYVLIAVSDTGVGMAPELLEKVFEPFFTTKPIGEGTGLGLSMVYGFARQSGGVVRIESRPGAGTVVNLYLPATDDDEGEARPADAKARRAGAGQTVLVVEDDASVRMLVREVLADLAYTVIEAGDADAAIPVLASDQPVQLMVSDVGLPGMDGRRLAELARTHRPSLPILFVTGYAENATVRADFLGDNMSMITKPFSLEVLAAKINEMIDLS
ncbi:MAG: response regulator [Caulobacter sp.]|nr:response regulator [Caulobacter sp.]